MTENSELAGLGTPQGTVFAEYDFAAVDKNIAVEEREEAMGIFKRACRAVVGPISSEISEMMDEYLMGSDSALEFDEEMLACGCNNGVLSFLTAAEETDFDEFMASKISQIQCEMHFVSEPYPPPSTEEERAATWEAMKEFALSCGNRFQHIMKLSKLCRWFATKDRSLNPISFVLAWLDLTYRRRRKAANAVGLDKLFSFPSCGGCPL